MSDLAGETDSFAKTASSALGERFEASNAARARRYEELPAHLTPGHEGHRHLAERVLMLVDRTDRCRGKHSGEAPPNHNGERWLVRRSG